MTRAERFIRTTEDVEADIFFEYIDDRKLFCENIKAQAISNKERERYLAVLMSLLFESSSFKALSLSILVSYVIMAGDRRRPVLNKHE